MTQLYLNRNQFERVRDGFVDYGGKYSLRNETLVTLQTDLGLRAKELLNLKRDYVDLDEGLVYIPQSIQKGSESYASDTRIEIDPHNEFRTERILKRYLDTFWSEQESEYLFPSRESQRVKQDNYRKIVKSVCEAQDIQPRTNEGEKVEPTKANTHMFRHSRANLMFQSDDWGVYDITARLRHTSVTTTEQFYEHLQVV